MELRSFWCAKSGNKGVEGHSVTYWDGFSFHTGFGLELEAQKQLPICVELATRPELLLFLDSYAADSGNKKAYSSTRLEDHSKSLIIIVAIWASITTTSLPPPLSPFSAVPRLLKPALLCYQRAQLS
ncbi:hypothetical protein VP01_1171g3 [Puccinia sorghi]|uniref:Uncharacterized protein n=1 Tax=Puccinia sorghi TaxID=27349 RepID=A0A0L6VR82_9BASI|nr:hypothetical protein VP01_1171g3 [Puccinia sorghi]